MEAVALAVSLCLLISGVVAAILVFRKWDAIKSLYGDTWAKFGVAAARWLSAVLAILQKQVSPGGSALAFGVFIAATAWLVWEAVQYIAERKLKQSLGELESELIQQRVIASQRERQINIRASMMSFLRSLVNDKKQRLRGMDTPKETAAKRLARLSDCLSPEEHMIAILGSLAASLRYLHPLPGSAESLETNIRIGLYAPEQGFMTPRLGFDLSNKEYDPFSSYEKHRDRFSLDNRTDPAHSVQCIQHRRTLIVADTEADSKQERFAFFEEAQKNYLKSLIAHPISGLRGPSGDVGDAALVIDANKAGYFNEADRELLVLWLEEFSARLVLESHFLGKCNL